MRPAGTVGTDDSVLISSHPAAPAPPSASAERARPVGAAGSTPAATPVEKAVPFRAADDSDVGWGDADDANDDRLRRDKPPHW